MLKKTITILIICSFAGFGCGPKVDKQSSNTAKASNDFQEPNIGESNIEGYKDVELGPEDERIEIPGSQFGKAPKMKKPGKKSDRKNPAFWPKTDDIKEQMGNLKWGMTVKKVFSIFEAQIKQKYEPKLKDVSGDLLAEDQIRTKMIKELQKLKKSYVKFNGQTTGYEAHMIDVEFTHNNNESMLVWDADQFVEYLFFINGRFWKRLRLFRVDKLKGITFEEFLNTLKDRFGCKGQEFKNKDGVLEKVTWRDKDSYAAVIDGSKFYGVYGIRYSCAITETYIKKLRRNRGRAQGEVGNEISGMINKVTTSTDFTDKESSVIDSYTGSSPKSPAGSHKNKAGSSSGGSGSSQDEQKQITNDDLDDLF
jgi:hypothetical protein